MLRRIDVGIMSNWHDTFKGIMLMNDKNQIGVTNPDPITK